MNYKFSRISRQRFCTLAMQWINEVCGRWTYNGICLGNPSQFLDSEKGKIKLRQRRWRRNRARLKRGRAFRERTPWWGHCKGQIAERSKEHLALQLAIDPQDTISRHVFSGIGLLICLKIFRLSRTQLQYKERRVISGIRKGRVRKDKPRFPRPQGKLHAPIRISFVISYRFPYWCE